MTLEDYKDLHDILQELRREAENLETQIDQQLGYIREAEVHLRAMNNREPEDKKIFSPRKMDLLYKEEIGKIREEKDSHEKQNRELCDKKGVIDKWTSTIEKVLGNQQRDFSAQTQMAKDQYKSSLEDLYKMIDKIESRSSSIEKNPIQARQDFTIIAKDLRETVDKMREAFE